MPMGGTGVIGGRVLLHGGSVPMGGTGVIGGRVLLHGGAGAGVDTSGGPGGRFVPGHVQALVGSQNGKISGRKGAQHGHGGLKSPMGGTGCAGGKTGNTGMDHVPLLY